MTTDFTPFPPLAQLAADLSAGRTTSRALVETALERIADPAGQGSTVFLHIDADSAAPPPMRTTGCAQPARCCRRSRAFPCR